MATHSSILARESHEQKSLVGYSPQESKESNTTERLSTHTHTHTHTHTRTHAHTHKYTAERIGAPFLHIASICMVNAVTASSSSEVVPSFFPEKEAGFKAREAHNSA